MGEPLLQRASEFLLPGQLDKLIETLPAAEQARIRWTRPVFRKLLDGLLAKVPNQQELASAALDLGRIVLSLVPAFTALRTHHSYDALRYAFDDMEREVGSHEQSLRAFLGSATISDESAGDSAALALRAVAASIRFAASQRIDLPAWTPSDLQDFSAQTQGPWSALLRAEIIVLALLDAARENRIVPHAADLAHLACLEASEGLRALERAGVNLRPYPEETEEERRFRLERTFQQLSDGMTEEIHASLFPSGPADEQ